MLFLTTSDNKTWAVPDGLVASSPFLRDLAASADASSEKPPQLEESFDTCVLLMKLFVTDEAWPDSPNSLGGLGAASRLIDKLHLPFPRVLERFNAVVIMETVRASGVANPHDTMAVIDLSKELQRHHPEYVRRVEDVVLVQGMYRYFLESDTAPEDVIRGVVGDDYSIVAEMAAALKYRHA